MITIIIIIIIISYTRIISYVSPQDEEMANLWTPHAKNLNPTHLKWLYNSIPRSRGDVASSVIRFDEMPPVLFSEARDVPKQSTNLHDDNLILLNNIIILLLYLFLRSNDVPIPTTYIIL